MKFAKILLASVMLVPTVASAQPAPPAPPTPPLILPTNFLFVAPAIIGFVSLPFILGGTDDAVAVPTPAPTPTTGTR